MFRLTLSMRRFGLKSPALRYNEGNGSSHPCGLWIMLAGMMRTCKVLMAASMYVCVYVCVSVQFSRDSDLTRELVNLAIFAI